MPAVKKLGFYAVMLGFVLLLFEAFAFATFFFTDDLYDHRDAVLERIDPEGFADAKRQADLVLGWEPRGPSRVERANCVGEEIEYVTDDAGARPYAGYDGAAARVVVVGDSYTFGDEAVAEDSYPARLAALLGAPVANLGVGGYGPVQSFLRLKRKLELYPRTEIVVLTVMYENVYRMMNSYRPVLYDKTNPFSFKPFMSEAGIGEHPGAAAFADLDRLTAHANRAFDEDFWAKPRHRFPYSLSLARALDSNFFRFRKLQKRFRNLGYPEYFMTFGSDAFAVPLFGLLEAFSAFAEERGVTPAVVFVPRNRLDTESVSKLLDASADRIPAGLIVGDVARADLDWEAFNLYDPEDDNICHPSPYGYRAIAEFMDALLRSRGAWPAGRTADSAAR